MAGTIRTGTIRNGAIPPVISVPPLATEAGDRVGLAEIFDDAGQRSWPFRVYDYLATQATNGFGIVSIVLILAILAAIPILQFLSLGYFFESMGRVGRSGRLRDGLVGLQKASRLGSFLIGSWIALLPLRWISHRAYLAEIIESQNLFVGQLQFWQMILTALVIGHIAACWVCGGKLRHFFWPLLAPLSLCLWCVRKIAARPVPRAILDRTLGLISRRLVDDLTHARSLSDWFVPVVLWRQIRQGTLLDGLREGAWDFAQSLRCRHYFWLGFRGFIGSLLWILPPSLFLIGTTVMARSEWGGTEMATGLGLLVGLAGILFSSVVFVVLPILQAHYASQQRMSCFAEPGVALRTFGKAPFLHWLAVTVMCVFALPLFIADLEEVPAELLWTLNLFFVALMWPTKILIGWAYGRAQLRSQLRARYIRWPLLLACLPITFGFSAILLLTQFTSYRGAWSLVENHVFLLPAPYWLGL